MKKTFKDYLETIENDKFNLTKNQKLFLKKALDNHDWDFGDVSKGLEEYLKRTNKKISQEEIKDLIEKNILKLTPKYDSKRNKFTHLQMRIKPQNLKLV